MSGSVMEREPCPDRILDDAGMGFAMGIVGGSAFHFLKGIRNSPNGTRIIGGMQAARTKAPRVGGSFAVWSGLFSTFDCTMVYVRQKEDPWNSIIAGVSTGGVLALRRGLRATAGSAIGCGALLALIEGVGLISNRFFSEQQNPPSHDLPPLPADDPNLAAAIAAGGGGFQGMGGFPGLPQPAVSTTEVASSSGRGIWLGGLFGKEEKKKLSSSGGTSEILESFETPSPPIPSFEYK